MEKCTKITINGVEKLVGDGDLVVVKMQHPIERMKKHCYSYYQGLKPEEVVDVYNNDNTIRKYLSIYNNSYIPGYTVAEVNINIDYTYPSTFSLSTRQCNNPSYGTNFFFRYDSETMADDKVEIVDWITTKRAACGIDNSFIEFSDNGKILDRSKYQDHDIGMVYDSIRQRGDCHTFSSQITVQDLFDYEQQQITPEQEDLIEARAELNELTNDETVTVGGITVPVTLASDMITNDNSATLTEEEVASITSDEADIAEARLAQIDVMHEVAEQEAEQNQNLTNTIDGNDVYHGELTEQNDGENEDDGDSIIGDFNDEPEDGDDADTNN